MTSGDERKLRLLCLKAWTSLAVVPSNERDEDDPCSQVFFDDTLPYFYVLRFRPNMASTKLASLHEIWPMYRLKDHIGLYRGRSRDVGLFGAVIG